MPSILQNITWHVKPFSTLKFLKTLKLEFRAGESIGMSSKWKFAIHTGPENTKIGLYLFSLKGGKRYSKLFADFDASIKDSSGQNNLTSNTMCPNDMATLGMPINCLIGFNLLFDTFIFFKFKLMVGDMKSLPHSHN